MIWKNKSVKLLLEKYNSNDPIELIRTLAREMVIKAYNGGWQGPPFNPIELSKLLGIKVFPNESVIDARIVPQKDNKFTIEYNPYQKDSRINFSIAHDIGHTIFPDCNERVRNRESEKDSETWELEFLCNIAASEILLPYAEFSKEANSVNSDLDSLLLLANKYQASIESVFLRYCDVIDKPCSIIIATFQDIDQTRLKIDYTKSSYSSKIEFPSYYQIPNFSKAYDCLNPGWTSFANEKWDVFGNEFHKVYSIGLPSIKKQNNSRVGVLIVPLKDEEVDKNEIYTVNGDATQPRGEGLKIIGQIINTSGALGFGFGRSMSKAFPESKRVVQKWKESKRDFALGYSKLSRLSEELYVFQMIAQKGIFEKDDVIPLRYDSLKICLEELAVNALKLKASVHMPLIGAGQAKGDWNIIEGMIYEILIRKGIKVSVYILPGTKLKMSKDNYTLSLFD